ncbi:MAG TPA: crosslink repair DNA glycosylase YcaQ family protein [Candidatus Dormibacteraeota bacterium]|nr:crosslink repair DNA glycosylase YcaQ family protein [Candidatus Dormibacteraeota bacterium]
MSEIRHVSAAAARRFLALRHLLAPPRQLPAEPESVLRVIDRIGSLQFDPLEIAGRNHDLVLLARIAGYRRVWTDRWLYEDRRLYETYNKGLSIVPVAELPWYRHTWDSSHAQLSGEGEAFDVHGPLVEELLGRIRDGGRLLPREVGPREAIDWYWRPTNQVRAILEGLAEAGILGIARREGNLRVYDLIERLVPAAVLGARVPEEEQRLHRLLSRYRAGGLLGTAGQQELWIGTYRHASERSDGRQALVERGELVPVAVEGVKGDRFVVKADLSILATAESEVDVGAAPGGFAPGVAFLAPLDPFCWDRDLLRRLFGFDYLWEVYVPAAKRRWGYYVLPILFGDRLVGRIEPRIERRAGTLRIAGLWWEPGFDPLDEDGFVAAFADALRAHREFGDLRRITFPRVTRHRPIVTAVRGALAVRDRGPREARVGRCRPRRTSKEALDGRGP